MTETIREYFRRFDNSITQSIYSTITVQQFYRNKAANQYLDYDRESLFRKNKQYCGIRNIDNSCYLSATLQILYNIQWMRERIFRVADKDASDFLKQIQKLFAIMYKGSLIYVDPSDLFAVLKKLHPDVFITGVQNDFHQVFTIILDQLQKSLIAQDDKRFFKKLFYGKTKVMVTDQKGKISNNSYVDTGNSFNLINLSSDNRSFDSALKNFKKQIIDGFISDSGQKLKATKEVNFLQTPAILSFFINRVSFKNKKLVKDSSQFDFQQKILFSKTSSSKMNKSADSQIQKQICELNSWIESIKQKKEFIVKTLGYFEQQFTNINIPNIANPLGQQLKQSTKKYLKQQVEGINKQIEKTMTEVQQLEKKRIKQAQQSSSEPYSIWGLMIHCGSTAQSGHYKICIKVDSQKNTWIQFNDRKAQEISNQKILQYKKKGQICCLFYRRSTLVAQPEKAQISSSLKKYVQQQQQKIFKKIDEARILQSLYQQYQSINIIWQHQNLILRQQQKISNYFFNPLLHLILSNTPPLVCKGFLLYQTIQQDRFISSVKNKLIDQNREIKIPDIDFGIPTQYWNIHQALKQFLCLQLNNPVQAFQLISFYMDISITNKITSSYFEMLRQVIALKGVFYQSLFVENNLLPAYDQFSKIMDRILGAIGHDKGFVLVIIPTREVIRQKYLKKIVQEKQYSPALLKKHSSVSPALIKQIAPTLFCKRFGAWMELRKNYNQIDQSILNEYKKFYSIYVDIVK